MAMGMTMKLAMRRVQKSLLSGGFHIIASQDAVAGRWSVGVVRASHRSDTLTVPYNGTDGQRTKSC